MAISSSFHDPHFYSLSVSDKEYRLWGHEKKPAAWVDSNLHEEVDLVIEHGKPVNDHNAPDLNFRDTVVPGMPEFDRKLGAPAKRMAPLVTLQKKVYMSMLRRGLPKLLALSSGTCSHQSLDNIVIQLRKAGSHPHLFAGIEPEPYEEGEHLVQASGKLVVLDQLLQKLHTFGHRVLLFAQMTHTLNVLQQSRGVGLNLVAADTVNFAILTSMEQGV
ncbi:unnamed protein product [Lactuca saligna]|uniref:Uncharacterized protein n=1 Tax=Lactuca saligna TaxID=75948 RepID=A0AA35YYV4_LACSI|nr:unnamed protein product [Lactuca saligna]